MAQYRVTWEMDIEAESPRKAAQLAREIHLDSDSIATCFYVDNLDNEDELRVIIDLDGTPE